MKIAQVTPYDFHHPGGVSRHIAHLRNEFERMGHEVVILAPRSSHGGIEVRDGFYGIGRTFTVPGNGSRARLTFDVTLYNVVKEILQRERFDVVHLHEPLTPVLPYMVLFNSKAVNVATFHAARASNPWYSAFKPYFSFVLSRLDGRIAVSEAARDLMLQYFDGPYDIIPNGIDLKTYHADVEPFPWARDGTPRILFVGRFNETRKGFTYLLRAMPLVHQQFPRARLVVVGPGKPEKFDGTMWRYGVANVDFVGQVSASELPRYYASCDLFCAPSIERESFGMVLLEAMACGKPVIATNISGYAGVVAHEREGLLVEPRNPAALALAIVRLLADRELRTRFSIAGQQTAARYAWPRIAARVLDIYEQAAAVAGTAKWRQNFG
ncbi:MAG TPA: glycosyltransferase family 4 protein [Thermomicrobiales bacterium]